MAQPGKKLVQDVEPALLFDVQQVAMLVMHLREHGKPQTLYGEETGLGLWLVGDHGVYLMSNSEVKYEHPLKGKEGHFVAYAYGCNPDENEAFYDVKVSLYGGDDGVDFFDIKDIEDAINSGATHIGFRMSEDSIAMFSTNYPKPHKEIIEQIWGV